MIYSIRDGVYPELRNPVVIGVVGSFLLDVRMCPSVVLVRPQTLLNVGVVGLDEPFR